DRFGSFFKHKTAYELFTGLDFRRVLFRSEDIIIVAGSNKRAIEDHFDEASQDLGANLIAGGVKKQHYLEAIRELASMANFVYVQIGRASGRERVEGARGAGGGDTTRRSRG